MKTLIDALSELKLNEQEQTIFTKGWIESENSYKERLLKRLHELIIQCHGDSSYWFNHGIDVCIEEIEK